MVVDSTTEKVRANEWWEYKIVQIFAVVYATAAFSGIDAVWLVLFLPLLMLALVPGAVFVSVINDLTDLEDDAAAEKPNRMKDVPRLLAVAIVSVCLIVGIAFSLFLDRISLICYLGAWLSYTLYSLPPVRLKNRGFAGVIADALGANVFPVLFSVSFLVYLADAVIDWTWFIVIGAWSLMWGMRGIIWHQIKDAENDAISETRTFVRLSGESRAVKFVHFLIFPLEVIALTLVILLIAGAVPFAALILYLFVVWIRYTVWEIEFSLVKSSGRYRIFLEEYYSMFLPLSLLFSALLTRTDAWPLFVFHLVLFPDRIRQFVDEVPGTLQKGWKMLRIFLLGH
jgi:4-hydroxybenzoate polyprenyltransferase